MIELTQRLIKLVLGNTLASFAISCVVKAGFGCFSTTAANAALSSWFGISIGMAGMMVELIMLGIATYKGEGIGMRQLQIPTKIDFLHQHPIKSSQEMSKDIR